MPLGRWSSPRFALVEVWCDLRRNPLGSVLWSPFDWRATSSHSEALCRLLGGSAIQRPFALGASAFASLRWWFGVIRAGTRWGWRCGALSLHGASCGMETLCRRTRHLGRDGEGVGARSWLGGVRLRAPEPGAAGATRIQPCGKLSVGFRCCVALRRRVPRIRRPGRRSRRGTPSASWSSSGTPSVAGCR